MLQEVDIWGGIISIIMGMAIKLIYAVKGLRKMQTKRGHLYIYFILHIMLFNEYANSISKERMLNIS